MEATGFTLDEILEQVGAAESPQETSPTGLRFNPFPVTGIGGAGTTLPPLEPAVSDQVREFLVSALRSHEFTGLTVVGDFGTGKTHLLRWIEHVVNSGNGTAADRGIRAYFVSNPGIRPMDILMSVTKAIGEEEFRKMLWAIVAAEIRERGAGDGSPEIRELFGGGRQRSLMTAEDQPQDALLHADVLANLGRFLERYRAFFLPQQALRDFVARVFTQLTSNLDVVQALSSMLLDDEMRAFTSWVSLTSTEGRQQLRVPQQDYFEAILNVLKRNGIRSIFLLIDEFEDVVGWRFSSRQRAEYLATLRLLIDDHVKDFSLILALTPEAWSLTKAIYAAFTDRMGKRIVDLRPLTPARAQELVRRYLESARVPTSAPEDALRPFTADAIQELVRLTEGNQRAFVSTCHRVLQRHWSAALIDADAVRGVVSA